MKKKKYEGTAIRQILVGMVTDEMVCGRISSQWNSEGLFEAPWANLVGGWCVKHFGKYGRPPHDNLRPIFDSWASRTKAPEETIENVERFLSHLAREHDESPKSSEYIMDVAGEHFNQIQAKRSIMDAEALMDRGEVEQAQSILRQTGRVEMGGGSIVKPGLDFDVWREAWDNDTTRPLIGYPGKLNTFLGRWMVRDTFLAFMGPDKSGKSMWLLDAAYRALRSRRRVVYFEAGDMSRDQVLHRLGQRITRRPMLRGTIQIPTSVDHDCEVEFKSKKFPKDLSSRDCYRAMRRLCGGRDLFRMACYPNDTMSADDLGAVLQSWVMEGWVPDVIVIDYADILAAPRGIRDSLDQIDSTWKALRRMSQEYHALVLTATQSDAKAYDAKRLMSRSNFSGRKTKLAHVNGMIGLNINAQDKENDVTRLNWVVRRSGSYKEQHGHAVAGCFAIAAPCLKSE